MKIIDLLEGIINGMLEVLGESKNTAPSLHIGSEPQLPSSALRGEEAPRSPPGTPLLVHVPFVMHELYVLCVLIVCMQVCEYVSM